MPNLRTLVLLEPPIKKMVSKIAHTEGVSISALCRDLIREALEIHEDRYWDNAAKEREKGFNWSKANSHTQVWKRLRKVK